MFSIKTLGFLSLIGDCAEACKRLDENGFGGEALSAAAEDFVCDALRYSYEKNNNRSNDDAIKIGTVDFADNSVMEKAYLSLYKYSGTLNFEIGVSPKEHTALNITADPASRDNAQRVLQRVLMGVTSAYTKGGCLWRCIAGCDSGAFLGSLIKAVTGDSVFGGKVCVDEYEAMGILSEIENTVSSNIARTEGKNVYEYNLYAENPVPVINLAVSDASAFSESFRTKLANLVRKAERGGINLFFIDGKNIEWSDFAGTGIVFEENGTFFLYNGTKLPASFSCEETDASAIEELTKEREISSLAEDNFSFETPPFSMNADASIKIPFALENGKLTYFEIGGTAPPHALLSGITGSGKSVTLHTIIDMITYNYHPDDAEIWAIDYKAVEFGCYATERTPHIRVIGQDNSAEFSISLIDMIYDEYRKRIKAFEASGVKKLSEYREKFGRRSMPRILIVIDEFHNLIQAVQNSFDSSYKTKLENLLKEMRAVGMSFLFCSQSIVSGLSGLTEAGKNQISIRLCMQHMAKADITETLAIKGSENIIIDRVQKFPKGHAMYRAGGQSDCKEVKILYISDELRSEMIKKANAALGNDYKPKDEIICKNSDRYEISEKPRHALNRFICGEEIECEEDETAIFPAAPTTLYPEYRISFSRNASNNLLVVGNDDDMRESVVLMTACSALASKGCRVFINIVNSKDADGVRLKKRIEKIHSERISVNFGETEVMSHIRKYAKLKTDNEETVFNFWYGLNRLKTAVTLALDSMQEEETSGNSSPEDDLMALMDSFISHTAVSEPKAVTSFGSYEDYASTLRRLFEFGPECGLYNIVAYNNPKSFSKDSFLKLADFDYRIGLAMSVDDSYSVFGSESFAKKANETTAVCYTGSKTPVSIRPYLIPSEKWTDAFNNSLKEREMTL